MMYQRLAGVAPILLASVTAACAPAAPSVDRRESSIYYGEPERGYEGVVMLQVQWSGIQGALCTGTVVAPRVVVTAKHCVYDDQGAQVAPDDVTVGTGPVGTRDLYGVDEIRPTGGNRVEGRDFAVLVTTQEIDGEPYPYAREWNPEEGESITLVGYGQRDDGDAGTKYLGENTLDYVFENYFTTEGEAACHGDSGGPAFDADGVLVGVIVNTLGGWDGGDSCENGVSGVTRVDYWSDIVDEAIDDAWVCDGAAGETCGDERDNDCDRIVDNGCLAIGDPCGEAVFCGSGDCRDLGDAPRCTSTCDLGGGECPEDFYCSQVACGEGACVVGEAGDLPLGAACEDDTECDNLSCLDAGRGGRQCLRACDGDGDCAGGEVCGIAGDAGCGGCVAVGDGAPFGAPCATEDDCGSAICVVDATGSFCSAACSSECPAGYECDDAGRCVHERVGGTGEAGAPCAGGGDCASDLCGNFEAGPACTEFCDPANACPASFSCVEIDGVGVCQPDLAIAGAVCDGNDDCLSDLCGHFDGFDACTLACGPDDPCPGGLLCVDGGSAGRFCRPEEAPPRKGSSGGCSVAGGGGAGLWILPIVLAVARRRRVRGARAPRAPRSRTALLAGDGCPSQLVAHCGGVNPPPYRSVRLRAHCQLVRVMRLRGW